MTTVVDRRPTYRRPAVGSATASDDSMNPIEPTGQAPSTTRRDLLGRPGMVPVLAWLGLGQVADVGLALVLAHALVIDLDPDATPAALAGVLTVAAIPFTLAPLAGAAVDHWDRRHLLGAANVVRGCAGAAVVAAVLADTRWLGLVAMAALLGAARLVYTARGAVLPHLVDRSELVVGESLVLVAGMVAAAVGGVAGAPLVDAHSVLVAGAATGLYLVSAIGFTLGTRPLGGGERQNAGSVTDLLAATARRVRSALGDRSTGLAIRSTASHRALLGGCFTAFVLVADTHLESDITGYAASAALLAAGAFVGTVTAPRTMHILGRDGVAIAASILGGAAAAFLAVTTPRIALGGAALFAAAFAFQNLRVVADATVQATAPDGVLGRVFAVYDAAYNLAFLAGALTGIGLVQFTSASVAFGTAAAGYIVIAVVHTVNADRRPW